MPRAIVYEHKLRAVHEQTHTPESPGYGCKWCRDWWVPAVRSSPPGVELTREERELAALALEYASTYAPEPNLHADALAAKLRGVGPADSSPAPEPSTDPVVVRAEAEMDYWHAKWGEERDRVAELQAALERIMELCSPRPGYGRNTPMVDAHRVAAAALSASRLGEDDG